MKNNHEHMWLNPRRGVFFIAIALAGFLSAAHAATTWNGSTGDWSIAGNWSGGVPADGGDAVITNGKVLLTNVTASLAALTISNATLTFSNWDTKLNATNVEVRNGASLTLPAAFTNGQMSNRVYIVCTNFALRTGGQIAASGLGYRGGVAATDNGNGPGRGTVVGATWNYGGGAGHGGRGGDASWGYAGGIYDPTNAPIFPGSGGGGTAAGSGGGAVRIDASNGPVIIEGTINVNGTTAPNYGGGGSGGSIYINCGTFTGNTNGYLTAKGGDWKNPSYASGSGGGGRIAVIYDAAAQAGQLKPTVRCNVVCGAGSGRYLGVIGTLYLTDSAVLTPDLSNFENVRIYGVTNWSLDTLAMSNGIVSFAEPRFTLTVTNVMAINTATLKLGSGITQTDYMQINCNWLRLTNQGYLYVYSGPTNAGTTNFGARVTVSNDILVFSNAWICPASDGTNGGSVFFSASNVTINPGGGFNANGQGYFGGYYSGYGPGGGKNVTGYGYGGGGGYGGKGGQSSIGGINPGGPVYPWTNAPRSPGSGGAGLYAGNGGGLVWLEAAGTVTLDGAIKANGNPYPGNPGSGGSGGGIFIVANVFRGAASGQLSAYGGDATPMSGGYYCGGGGGGRIAVWYRIPQSDRQIILADPDHALVNVPRLVIATDFVGTYFAGACTVSNGYSYAGDSVTGTVVRLTVPPPKGIIFMTH